MNDVEQRMSGAARISSPAECVRAVVLTAAGVLVLGLLPSGAALAQADASPQAAGAAAVAATDAPASMSHWPQLLGAQYTFVRQHQGSLHSPYQGPHSLDPSGDTQSTHTIGLYLGWAITNTLQVYFDTEKFMGAGVSGAVGLGGLTNGDVVREGANNLPKRFYIARRYIRWLLPLSEEVAQVERAQDRIPGPQATTRLELKVGTFAISDDFDTNRYANSTRTQFMDWALWNNAAWDYAADTRGYTDGVMLGYVSPTWSLKYGLFEMPKQANGQALELSIRRARGEQVELTLSPFASGAIVRVLGFRNIARMGVYRDAIHLAAATATTPNIVADNREGRKKYGFGVNLEQPLADQGETGLFVRAGWNDGRTESFAFTEVDRTLTFGAQLAGLRWSRPRDRWGAAVAINGLSGDHRDYLAAGGIGFLLGDGHLDYAPEQILETYYRIQLGAHVQLTPDVQYVRNPGFNEDRGPVAFWSIRLHLEY